MKYALPILTAAIATVSAMFRVVDRNAEVIDVEATVVPTFAPISIALVQKLAYAGATDADLADRFLIDEQTLRQDYAGVLRQARALRRIQLRAFQLDLAKKLNGPILTWLGRNELGQSLNPSKPGVPEPDIASDEN